MLTSWLGAKKTTGPRTWAAKTGHKIGEGAIFVLVWKGVQSAFVKICGVANLQSRSMEIVPAPSSRCCAAYELAFSGAKNVRTMNEGGGGKG